MKNSLIIILIFISCVVKGQKEPVDTQYYNNGNIKYILYHSDKYISGQAVKVYYDSIVSNKIILDTILRPYIWNSDYSNNPINPANFCRIYLDTGMIKEHYFIYPGGDLQINYERIITGVNNICIGNRLTDLKRSVSIYYMDTDFIVSTTISKLIFSISEIPNNQYVKINDTTGMEITFHENKMIKSIGFMINENVKNGKYIEFYNNGNINNTGNYIKGVKTGLWKEYYSWRILKSIGKYSGSWTGDIFAPDFIKTGTWLYFDKTGTLIDKKTY